MKTVKYQIIMKILRKNQILFFVLIFCQVAAHAAKPTISLQKGDTLTKSVSEIVAVELSQMNVLYIGVDNPMKLALGGNNKSEIKVTINNGKAFRQGDGYIIRPDSVGEAILSVFTNQKKLRDIKYRVKRIPDPIAQFLKRKEGEIDKSELLKAESLEALSNNFDFAAKFEIVSFNLVLRLNGFAKELRSLSNRLTQEQKDCIKRTVNDDRFLFTEIIAVGPDGVKRQLNDLTFKVKDPETAKPRNLEETTIPQ
jgi:hypothetical protein